MYAFFVRKYGNKRYRMYNGTFSEFKCAGLFYELLKKAGLPQGTQVQLRFYDINSHKWKGLGDWEWPLISPQLNDRCSGLPTYHQVPYRLT